MESKKTFFQEFISMFYEDDSKWWSSMRFVFVYGAVISVTIVWIVWGVLSIIENKLMSIPSSVITLFSIATTLGFGSKLLQKREEKKLKELDTKK